MAFSHSRFYTPLKPNESSKAIYLRLHRDVAQVVEYTSGGRVVAGSSPVILTNQNPHSENCVGFTWTDPMLASRVSHGKHPTTERMFGCGFCLIVSLTRQSLRSKAGNYRFCRFCKFHQPENVSIMMTEDQIQEKRNRSIQTAFDNLCVDHFTAICTGLVG